MFADFRWDLIVDWMPFLLTGVQMTILLTTIAVGAGTIIGLVISLMRISNFKLANWIGKAYVDFLRGTPLLVQIFIVHFAGPEIVSGIIGDQIRWNAFYSGVVALSLNSGAYIAEIFRGGIQSIERGQMEAARSLGMTYPQAMRYVVLPQAFKRSIPPLGNEYIAMLKDSSLVAVIAVQDLMMAGRVMAGRTYRPVETYFAIAFMYLIMTMTIAQLVAYLERRYGKSDKG
ncbi:polar amino acid transport system permease protein [Desulfitispora alkaliphila]|uniref:amino acid ABC transporter permease n=1 Tax=Desulfitispora alkaliphila TaxID=622674 RepID=UPI003D23AA7C